MSSDLKIVGNSEASRPIVTGRGTLASGPIAEELIERGVSRIGAELRWFDGTHHAAVGSLFPLVRDLVGVERVNPRLVSDVEAYAAACAPELSELPDPHLVAFADGTAVNAKTGQVCTARRADNLHHALTVPFNAKADRTFAAEFLNSSIPRDFQVLAREMIGLAISGWRDLQVLFWLYGPPGGGKSTLLRAVGATHHASARASVAPHATSANRFAAGQLLGAAVNVVPDVSARDWSDPAFIKMATGQDRVFVERKHREPTSAAVWALNLFASNSLPSISDPDNALGRRVVPIPVARQNDAPTDPNLTARLLEPENLQALAMLGLEALFELHERGVLTTNPAIEAARAHFRSETNAVALFLAERCQLDADGTARRSDLWAAFRAWADDSRRGKAMGRSAFLRSIESDHGITFTKRRGEFVADGIRLELPERG